MSLMQSSMIELGTKAPEFTLPDTVSGKKMALYDLQGNMGTVVMFICNHCPYVKHVQHELVNLATSYNNQGISFVAISANDASKYPEDGPDKMKQVAQDLRYPFPYLYDETQAVAKAYNAVCTPDFFIFDKDLKCIYRGRLDASSPGNDIPVSGKDIRTALDDMIAGKAVNSNQSPSMGCNIKWK